MIISNCHKKLRSSQTWGAKVMRYVNYSCVLILMIYPNNLKRESEIESWFQEHTDDGGLLKKLPPWEYVCRFFKYYDLVKVEQLYRAHRNESSSDPEQIVSEEKEKSSKPTNGRNSPPNEVYLESKKKFQERYMNLNMKVHDTIEEEIHKYKHEYKHREVDKNFYLPDLKKHRAFVSDLFNYMWKYHSRFKVGVWHHENANIGNKPITATESSNKDKSNDTTQAAILNVIKNGIHEEEFEFMEVYLEAEGTIYNQQRSKFGRLVSQDQKPKSETTKNEI